MSGQYKDIKHDAMLTWDSYDAWGWAMTWWFEVADEMTRRGLEVPQEWHYKPGLLDFATDAESYEQETLGLADDDALEQFGNILARYARILEHQGKSY
jgi:hypothetical protein